MPVLYGEQWSQQLNQERDRQREEKIAKDAQQQAPINALIGAAVGYLTAGLGSIAMGTEAAAAMAPSVTTIGAAVKGGAQGLAAKDPGTAAVAGGLTGLQEGIEAPAKQAELTAKRAKDAADLEAVKRATAAKYGTDPQLQAIITPPAPVKTDQYGLGQVSVASETPANLTTTTTPGTLGTESPGYIAPKDVASIALEKSKLAETVRNDREVNRLTASRIALLSGQSGDKVYLNALNQANLELKNSMSYKSASPEEQQVMLETRVSDILANRTKAHSGATTSGTGEAGGGKKTFTW